MATRALLASLLALAGCSIDRSGLGPGDAGREARDAGPDAGPADAGPPPAIDACAGCECTSDPDCAGIVEGPWSACEGFDGPCDPTGMQSRVVTEWRCVSNRCTGFDNTVAQPCERDVEGIACGSVSAGEWSECAYPGPCANDGMRTRTVTSMVCRSGGCVMEMTPEMEACSRDVEGDFCTDGSCSGRCLFGGCQTGCISGGCDERCPTTCTGRCEWFCCKCDC